MGILKYLFCIILFICFVPYTYALDSKETSIKKSIHVKDDKRSNYKINNFTNININSTKKEKQEEPKNEVKTTKSYEYKLRYLQSLRYEVMSLKEQIGDDFQASVPYGNYIDDKASAIKFNALTQSYNDALKKSGLFVGVNIGFLNIYTNGYIDNNLITTRIKPLVYGGNGGYQKFFNQYIGTRLYGGFFTSFFNDVYTYNVENGATSLVKNPYGGNGNLESFYMLAFMSADLLFEFPLDNSFKKYIGGFMGINIGIMYYRPYASHPQKGNYYPAKYIWNYNLQVDYSFNLGTSLTFNNIHRVELGLNIPLSYLSLPGFSESANMFEKIPANFWRSAVFLANYRILIKF